MGDREIKESEMTEPKVWVFFYGSFLNLYVLRAAGLVPDRVEVAWLGGFNIVICPPANLIRSDHRDADLSFRGDDSLRLQFRSLTA
jgi:hypothetical protein